MNSGRRIPHRLPTSPPPRVSSIAAWLDRQVVLLRRTPAGTRIWCHIGASPPESRPPRGGLLAGSGGLHLPRPRVIRDEARRCPKGYIYDRFNRSNRRLLGGGLKESPETWARQVRGARTARKMPGKTRRGETRRDPPRDVQKRLSPQVF